MPIPSPTDELLAKLRQLGDFQLPDRVRIDSYGDSDELSQELLDLIRSGRKRANASLVWSYEHDGESMPQMGDVDVVVDHLGNPALITRNVDVRVLPYCAVSPEHAAAEGEGDGSIEYWRRAHWSFFSRECERMGRVPTEAMLVVCIAFEVVAVIPPQSI